MRMSIQAGDTLTFAQIKKYIDFLREGGAIQYFKTAKQRLETALVVATLEDELSLVGMGVLKARYPEYNAKIAERSGWPLSPHKREIGYIAVAPAARGRGFSNEIVRRLLDFDDRVFATTSNPAMMRTFRNLGFQREGHEWESKEGATLSLWMKGK